MALSTAEGGGGTKAERVGRWEVLWVVGALEDGGGGWLLLKFVMDQRTMLFSFRALERMRSPHHDTQSTMLSWISEVEK